MLLFFFFNDTATTEIYTLSLHDALPICPVEHRRGREERPRRSPHHVFRLAVEDRKITRLNSSHSQISYAVFCLKKKKNRAGASISSETSALLMHWLLTQSL